MHQSVLNLFSICIVDLVSTVLYMNVDIFYGYADFIKFCKTLEIRDSW